MPANPALTGTQALVRVLEAAEEHTLPVPELVEQALALQGWKKTSDGTWKHRTLTGRSPAATLAAQVYTGEPFIKVGRGVVRLRTETDPPHERKRYARAMTLEEAQAAVAKAEERLSQAKATLKAIEDAAREGAADEILPLALDVPTTPSRRRTKVTS